MGRAEDLFARIESRGVAYLRELADAAKAEEAHLEFKGRRPGTPCAGFQPEDRVNLIRALSGFANSDGGVVIWGVGRDKRGGSDVPTLDNPLADCRSFCGRIEDAVSGCTTPPVPGVRSIAIPIDADAPAGFVGTLIPASPVAPHQTIDPKGYLMRSGSSFVPVMHSVLSGLFGRQPRPALMAEFDIGELRLEGWTDDRLAVLDLGYRLRNIGAVVARDLYLAWHFKGLGGPKCRVEDFRGSHERYQVDSTDGTRGTCLAAPGNRLAPFAEQLVKSHNIIWRPPLEGAFQLVLTYGCDGLAPTQVQLNLDATSLGISLATAKSELKAAQELGGNYSGHAQAKKLIDQMK